MRFSPVIFFISLFYQFSAYGQENMCTRMLNNYVKEVAAVPDISSLTTKYKRSISPASDFLQQHKEQVAAAYRPVEEIKARALSKSRRPEVLQSYIDFHTNHRGTRIPEELITFLNTDQQLADLLKKQRRWIYLKNENYEKAMSLGQELYDLHRSAVQNNCGTTELLRLSTCAKIRFSFEALKIKLLPYLNEVKDSANTLAQFEKSLPAQERQQADKYLRDRTAVDYELARKSQNPNYALLTAIEKFENGSSLKVETYDLNHSNGDKAALHILRNQQQAVVGFAFGKPVDVISTNQCREFYLLFDLNESNNYFKIGLLGHVESRLDLQLKGQSRVSTYLDWVSDATKQDKAQANTQSNSSFRRYLPAFLGGTSR
jgi:hypothetical protein